MVPAQRAGEDLAKNAHTLHALLAMNSKTYELFTKLRRRQLASLDTGHRLAATS